MKKATKGPSIKTAQALLAKHECPVPFHEVRTRFLGNIATPAISASPLQIIKDLWGGELPPFDSIEEVNELLDTLVQGLWNDLTRHQKRSQPFRLTRPSTEPTAVDLGQYGLVRLQELDGFIEGLFNGEDVIDLPERAHEAVDRLAEMRAMMAGICELVSHAPDADDAAKLDTTFRHLRELTRIMETEINEAVLSCTRARRQMIEGILTEEADGALTAMISEDQLREKLRKIEALYAGAKTDGEKSAAGAAAERIRAKFENASKQERAEEFKFSISDPWSRQLFIALCRRYGIKPFRYTRMHRQTVIIRAPASFVQMTLWPEFEELSSALTAHLDEITTKIIREEVHEATQDADEVREPRQLR